MKYNLHSKNINQHLTLIVVILTLVGGILTPMAHLNAQIRPLDNGELAVVNKGGLQSDTYYSNKQIGFNDQHALFTTLRYGLSSNFELQMSWRGQRDQILNSVVTSEVTNIGVKIRLTEDTGLMPGLSAIVSAKLTLDPETNPILPSLNVLYEKTLSSSWFINGNLQASLDEQLGEFTTGYSFVVESAITNWMNAYVGAVGNSNGFGSESLPYQHYLEIGLLLWTYDGVTIYPYYDIGLNDVSGDIFNLGALITIGK